MAYIQLCCPRRFAAIHNPWKVIIYSLWVGGLKCFKQNRNFKKEERINKKPFHEVSRIFPGTCYRTRLALTEKPVIKSSRPSIQNSIYIMLITVSLGYKEDLKCKEFKVNSKTKTNPTRTNFDNSLKAPLKSMYMI